MRASWTFWIDVGGTFTDCIGRDPGGEYHQAKLLSADDAPIDAIRRLMDLGEGEQIGPVTVGLGTTRGTNALLERKGADVALAITRGFADLIEIGTQARPHLFRLHIEKPPVLHRHVVEIDERLDAQGGVIAALDEGAARRDLQAAREAGFDSLAICLLHAYVNDDHEARLASMAREMGFGHVSVSSELSPTIKALDRADTTVLDAYLSPIIRSYLANLRMHLPEGRLQVMTSAGAMIDSEAFVGKDSLLSGPAGGVVGCAHVAKQAGFDKAIGFDMGGTSTDVSRYDGRYEYEYAGEMAGVRIVSPMLAIETVAAGGGSICDYDGQRLTVGPESAGAEPGPACYGRGGPLALTDINLFNGKIDPKRFPFELDVQTVRQRLEALAERMDEDMSLHRIADGFTRVANLKMAAAIRRISTAKGYDPADHVLVAFGGAAAQHACAIARSLGIGNILLHPLAGVLSAHGISMADVTRFAEQSVLKPLSKDTLEELEPTFARLADELREKVSAEGLVEDRIDPAVRLFDLRYEGEQTPITIAQPDDGDWAEAFARMHRQLYGHAHDDRGIEIATLRVEVTGRMPKPDATTAEPNDRTPEPAGRTTVYFDAQPHDAAWYERDALHPGDRIKGPAIIYEQLSTIVIDPGWTARMTERFDLLFSDEARDTDSDGHAANALSSTSSSAAAVSRATPTQRDPIRLELFNNHFTHIATQMGITLQRTSLSVNVKERLDFSCAILDAQGELVVNAPHIPVHLGAMSATVTGLLDSACDLQPGDAYLCNDPDLGGSHLPDLTVMTPVFDEAGEALRFFAASRAHHAEIGGVRPGSTFPFARNLAEEGVVFRNLRLMHRGRFDEAALRDALENAPHPSRAPSENIADVRAAIAANTLGARELASLIAQHTWPVVAAYMGHIREAAAAKARAAIRAIPDGGYTFDDQLDDGSPLRIAVTVDGEHLTIDFTGTGPVNDNAFNANAAVVQSAVLYCLRCLIDEDIPLNGGVLQPVDIILPACMLNPPTCADASQHAAVAAGNVELSQRVVDMFLGALSIAAASQGTMNNFIFGAQRFGYYETICGGAGAGPDYPGADAVHTHMTNTRLTDVEVLEKQYPIRVRRFAIRRPSGGAGQHRGGHGVIRTIEFLQPVQVSLLTQRRTIPPFGLHGGAPGRPGRNLLQHADSNQQETLDALAQFDAAQGDILTLETPGGGGYGPATDQG